MRLSTVIIKFTAQILHAKVFCYELTVSDKVVSVGPSFGSEEEQGALRTKRLAGGGVLGLVPGSDV